MPGRERFECMPLREGKVSYSDEDKEMPNALSNAALPVAGEDSCGMMTSSSSVICFREMVRSMNWSP